MSNQVSLDALSAKQKKLAQLGIALYQPRYREGLQKTLSQQEQRNALSGAERLSTITTQEILAEPSLSNPSIKKTTLTENTAQLDASTLPSAPPVSLSTPFHGEQRIEGSGDRAASWMVISDAPRLEEARAGHAFAGAEGEMLDQLFVALKISRQSGLYYTHLVKHRLPDDRDPLPEEIAADQMILEREITEIQPRMIIVVGRHSAMTLLQTNKSLGELQQHIHTLQLPALSQAIPLIVTYSPTFLMRSPSKKMHLWQSICQAQRYLENA